MITYGKKIQTTTAFEFDFKGMSSDTKPTETYEGSKIGNGSTFMELDTKTLFYYDEAGKQWV